MSSQRIDQCRTLAACGQTPWLHWPEARPAAPRWPAGAPTARRRQRWQLMQERLCTWCFETVRAMPLALKRCVQCHFKRANRRCRAVLWAGAERPEPSICGDAPRRICATRLRFGLYASQTLAACKTLASGTLWRRALTRINRFRAPRWLAYNHSCRCFQSRCCLHRVRIACGRNHSHS